MCRHMKYNKQDPSVINIDLINGQYSALASQYTHAVILDSDLRKTTSRTY